MLTVSFNEEAFRDVYSLLILVQKAYSSKRNRCSWQQMGSEGRNYQTTIKKTSRNSLITSRFCHSQCFHNDRNGGRCFNMVKPIHSGLKERPKYNHFAATDLAHSHSQCRLWDILHLHGGPVSISSVLLLCACFFMSHILSVTKVPCRPLFSLANPISSKTHTGDCDDVWK